MRGCLDTPECQPPRRGEERPRWIGMLQFMVLLLAMNDEAASASSHGGHCDLNNSSYDACNIHDICYFCGNNFDRSRLDCDSKFLEDMNSVCWKKTEFWELPLCLLFSTSFYLIVRTVSESYFVYDYSDHCQAPWVKPCIKVYYGQ
uniref:Conodipine-M alpha chain n=1 Tax=Magallana gigas TaxID=29159 RepID=A0A8W8KJ20_MAGGI